MIYLLIALIILLSLTIVVLSIKFHKARLAHNLKVDELRGIIVALTAARDDKRTTLQLSDELREKLYAARENIDRDLMDIQRDFAETVAKNKRS